MPVLKIMSLIKEPDWLDGILLNVTLPDVIVVVQEAVPPCVMDKATLRFSPEQICLVAVGLETTGA